jgi:hypothetical protein
MTTSRHRWSGNRAFMLSAKARSGGCVPGRHGLLLECFGRRFGWTGVQDAMGQSSRPPGDSMFGALAGRCDNPPRPFLLASRTVPWGAASWRAPDARGSCRTPERLARPLALPDCRLPDVCRLEGETLASRGFCKSLASERLLQDWPGPWSGAAGGATFCPWPPQGDVSDAGPRLPSGWGWPPRDCLNTLPREKSPCLSCETRPWSPGSACTT